MVQRVLLAVCLPVLLASATWAENYTIPTGTTLNCRLTQTLSTKLNSQNDSFTAIVAEPVMVNQRDIIPAGAMLGGRISRLARQGRFRGAGEMQLTADKITFPDGHTYPVNAILVTIYGAERAKVVGTEGTVKGPGSRLKNLEEIGGGMVAGGALGTIFGGFHGTLIGGAIGGAAGFVDRMRRRDQDVTLPTSTELKYQLTRDFSVKR